MQRRIQEADAHRHAFQRLVELFKVTLLVGQDLIQSGFPLGNGVGADHLTESGDAFRLKEHMLGTAQADAFRAQLTGLLGVCGGIGIGTDLHGAVLVCQSHDAAELAGNLGVHSGDHTLVDVAGGAVNGDEVALVVGLARQSELLVLLVHDDVAAAGNTAGAHAPGHNGSVGGHAAPDRQDALSSLHTGDVFGRGFQTHQNNLLTPGSPAFGIFRGEDDLAAGSSGRSAQAAADGGSLLQGLGIELGMQQGIQVPGIDHGHGLLLVDHAFVQQIAGNLQGGLGGTLAVTGLQHIELAVFHGELHILHIAVVVLQQCADLGELVVSLGELVRHLGNGHGGTDTGHHVFALGVGQELAHQLLLAGGGITGESNAGAGIVVQVAEYHGHDVHGSAPGVGDVVVTTVNIGTGVVPGTEHGADGFVQLNLGVGGEVLTQLCLVFRLELTGQLLQVLSGQVHIVDNALLLLHLVDELFKVLLAHFHNHVGEHLDEAAVGIVYKPGELGVGIALDHGIHNLVVEAQVQNGVHHTGHGGAGAGTNGNQQRILKVAELLAVDLLHLIHVLHDLGHDLVIDFPAVLVVLGAGFGRNSKALGNRQADSGHFSQIGALTAQKLTHGTVTLGEHIDILVRHKIPLSYSKQCYFA